MVTLTQNLKTTTIDSWVVVPVEVCPKYLLATASLPAALMRSSGTYRILKSNACVLSLFMQTRAFEGLGS